MQSARAFLSIAILLAVTAPAAAQLRTFGSRSEQTDRLPGFGGDLGRIRVIQQDLESAKSAIRKVDSDQDGVMSRDELRSSRYKNYESRRFAFDANRNNRLTVRELARYYAKNRADKEAAKKKEKNSSGGSSQKKAPGEAPLAVSFGKSGIVMVDGGGRDAYIANVRNTQLRQARNAQLAQLQLEFATVQHNRGFIIFGANPWSMMAAQEVMQHFDKNRNGSLDREEWERMASNVETADKDRNTQINMQELLQWLASQSGGSLNQPSKDWFATKDTDGDGQVTMAEYSQTWSAALLEEFQRYDRDGDGIITAAEKRASSKIKGREYANNESVIIESRNGAIGTIRVDDDIVVGDVKVRLSIHHVVPHELGAELVSPSGRRVKLFDGAGKKWKGADFRDTVFDDGAAKAFSAAAPPFRGPLRPEGADSAEKQGLAGYHGERGRGEWRLYLRAERSPRAGLLNGWTLLITPQQ